MSTTTNPWIREDFARSWTAGDVQADFLAVPRRIAAAIVSLDRPQTRLRWLPLLLQILRDWQPIER